MIIISLLIAYVGAKGCVMASDCRRISFIGTDNNLAKLEKELYSCSIATEDDLYKKAEEFEVIIKISDDKIKVKKIDDIIRGEVRSGLDKKTIYGTTNGYQMFKVINSQITDKKRGDKGIIIFGNNVAKVNANKLLNEKFNSSLSLDEIGNLFKEIIVEISKITPSVGSSVEVLKVNSSYMPHMVQKHLEDVIAKDLKENTKFISKDKVMLQNPIMDIVNRIKQEGIVGEVVSVQENTVEVRLNENIEAYDEKWNKIATSGQTVSMNSNDGQINIGDKVIIDNEKVCLEKNKSPLESTIILCNK